MPDPVYFGLTTGNWLASVSIIVTIWASLISYFSTQLNNDKELLKLRLRYNKKLDVNSWNRYRDGLRKYVTFIDDAFGFVGETGRESYFLRPWAKCLTLALSYPIIFYLFRFAVGGGGDLGGLIFLDPDLPVVRRIALVVWIYAMYELTTYGYRKDIFKAIFDIALSWGQSRFGKLLGWIPGISAQIAISGAVIALVFVGSFLCIQAFNENPSSSQHLTNSLVFIGLIVMVSGMATGGAITGYFCFMAIASLVQHQSLLIVSAVTFLIAFPIINSLIDWASLLVTRWLIGYWLKDSTPPAGSAFKYVIATLIDLLIAYLCVCLLAALFSMSIWTINNFSDQHSQIDWPTSLEQFLRSPFNEGLAITLMMFSTLIPSLFHLAVGTASMFRLPHIGKEFFLRSTEQGPPDMVVRLQLGALMSFQWLVMPIVWMVAILLTGRIFFPANWLFSEAEGPLLIWLPYLISSEVWSALSN